MTKEEILKKYTYSNILPESKWLHQAMQEYAEQQAKKEAILFHDWCESRPIDPFIETEQLYEIFKQQTNNK